jgi:hypothetical protein
MENVPSWPSAQRAAHYLTQAKKLRELAEMEPPGEMRDQLLALARDYDGLVANLTVAKQSN